MAGDSKTEKATPKKRQDERKKGNVFLSKDVISVVSLLGIFFVLKILFPSIHSAIKEYVMRFIGYAGRVKEITPDFVSEISLGFIAAFARIAMPLLLLSVFIAIVTTFAQTKMLFSFESLKPKFNRLNPLEGFKKMISLRSAIEIVKGIIKITILIVLIYQYFKSRLIEFPKTLSMDIISSCIYLLDNVMGLVINVSIAFVVISAFDYLYQWWDYERQIKMSKQDIKEEYKQTEGDPQIKGKIKENQRKMAMSRMMQAVPSADVVVRNPTHFAVALKYDIEKDNAPIVVAKGQDELALRIVKVAEQNHVYVIENKPLARAIYASTEINHEIPAEYYGTIAELLVYVYKLNHKEIK